MLVSVVATLLLVGVVGAFNAGQTALTQSRTNRLEDDLERGALGASTALRLSERTEEVVAATRVMVALLVVAVVLIAGSSWLSWSVALLGESSSLAVVASHCAVIAVLSFAIVVGGDLLPHELAMRHPEVVARVLAPVLSFMLVFLRPLAKFAHSVVTLALAPIKPEKVSDEDVEEDIRDLVDEGQRAGVIEQEEKEIIDRVFKLDDKPLATLMTPRGDVTFLALDANVDSAIEIAAESKHTWFPVRGASEDDVIGVVSLHDLILLRNHPERYPNGLHDIVSQPLEVPLSISALKLLEDFRGSGTRFGIVRDEYGGVSGIVTIYDVLQVIAGDIGDGEGFEERKVIQRDDGSYLVDAGSDVRDVFETLGIADESPFNGAEFHSLGGFVMTTLGYVPREGERFEALGYSFEVIDMDNKRIDKVLVSPLEQRRVVGS